MTLESKLRALVAELRGQAETSREEAGRIRRTVHVATEAEANCLIRAEVWDKCADRIEALLAERPRTPGEDAWLDEIEEVTCNGSRDKIRTILRAYRANLLAERQEPPAADSKEVWVRGELNDVDEDWQEVVFETATGFQFLSVKPSDVRTAAAAPSSGTGERKNESKV